MKKYCLLILLTSSLCASYVIEGVDYNPNALAGVKLPPSEDIYRKVVEAYQAHDWETVKKEGSLLVRHYPHSPFAQDVYFYLGTGLYQLRTFDQSDLYISKYLATEGASRHFEEAMLIKYRIARGYQRGKMKPLFGFRPLPNIFGAKEDALKIYDEIIASMPRHDLAAQSLYYKGHLLLTQKNYQESVETFQTLIRRFPKHTLAVDGYLAVLDVYLMRAKKDFADPDLLDLAFVNQRQFKQHFPTEGRVEDGEAKILQLKEMLAQDLMKVAKFYKKSKKIDAIKLYYTAIIERYPETACAREAENLLHAL
jgi:outer membrane protein assembly factor BamD (BamD/ComL family)